MSAKNPAQQAAEEAAAKREKHKPRLLAHKRWEAVHSPVKGWHVALVDCPDFAAASSLQRGRQAFRDGDLQALLEASFDHTMARVRRTLTPEQRND